MEYTETLAVLPKIAESIRKMDVGLNGKVTQLVKLNKLYKPQKDNLSKYRGLTIGWLVGFMPLYWSVRVRQTS